MKNGIELIADERQRQIEREGWTPEHDAEHGKGQLSKAGIAYARVAAAQIGTGVCFAPSQEPSIWNWPWSRNWWKPSQDPIRNLVKAGALIAAEIDRLQRRGIRGGE